MSALNYVEHIFLGYLYGLSFDQEATGRWLEAEELENLITEAVRRGLRQFGYEVGDRYDELALHHLAKMREKGVFKVEGDEFTGEYSQIGINEKDGYIIAARKKNEVSGRIEKLGQPALHRAVEALANIEGWAKVGEDNDLPAAANEEDRGDVPPEVEIPASDRIVRLDDNLVARDELNERLNELSSAVRGHNDEENALGEDRGRVIAEIESGKELLKGPSVRTRALWIVLAPALTFIAAEFAGGIIGELATQLLTALRAFLGI